MNVSNLQVGKRIEARDPENKNKVSGVIVEIKEKSVVIMTDRGVKEFLPIFRLRSMTAKIR